MTEDDARRVAEGVLTAGLPAFATGELIVTGVKEFTSAWAFNYNSRKYVETGDFRDSLVGNGALIVPKAGTEPWFTWSGDTTENQVALGRSTLGG